jgi:Holliday junction resolvase
MSAATRRKGLTGEREVADRVQDAGWELRGLESSGDWLALRGAHTLHLEVKRQERLKVPEWLKQAALEAPIGVPPVVCFRQSHGEWYAALRLDDLMGLIG